MSIIIKNIQIVNEDKIFSGDVLIKDERIENIAGQIDVPVHAEEIDGEGKMLFPGMIDDQVHFREPGLTHKGDILTESRAAVAGGITSFMEMPNTVPGATTVQLLEEKYAIASMHSAANYSFFMGTTNNNLEEVLRIEKEKVCGVKIFMGSSTGNMLVEDEKALEGLFSQCDKLIATHCESDPMIKENLQNYMAQYGDDIPMKYHGLIRSREACLASSSYAVNLAKKHGTRLHILHISTKEELDLFDNTIPLKDKKITAEACTHHLWFTNHDYDTKGTFIKWNPAVKTQTDRDAIRQAVIDGRIDVLATDHAPHTIEEKSGVYTKAPSGGPLVQHAMLAYFDLCREGVFTPQLVARKFAHNVADLFGIRERGYIREGYFADLFILDPNTTTTVSKDNLVYKCGWSPFEGHTFGSAVESTFVNGTRVWHKGDLSVHKSGHRLLFDR